MWCPGSRVGSWPHQNPQGNNSSNYRRRFRHWVAKGRNKRLLDVIYIILIIGGSYDLGSHWEHGIDTY